MSHEQEFVASVQSGDLPSIWKHIHNGVNPNHRWDVYYIVEGDPRSISTRYLEGTALHWAVEQEHTELVTLLLQHGVDPNIACNGYDYFVSFGESEQEDIEVHDRGVTPLHVAARNGSRQLVEILLRHKADISLRTEQGLTAADYTKDYQLCQFLRSLSDLGGAGPSDL